MNLELTASWEPVIRQLEATDLVLGGPDGPDNIAPKQLGNCTRWIERAMSLMSNPNEAHTVLAIRCTQVAQWGNAWVWGYSSDTYTIGGMKHDTLTAAAHALGFVVPAVRGTIVGASIRCAFRGSLTPSGHSPLCVTITPSNSTN